MHNRHFFKNINLNDPKLLKYFWHPRLSKWRINIIFYHKDMKNMCMNLCTHLCICTRHSTRTETRLEVAQWKWCHPFWRVFSRTILCPEEKWFSNYIIIYLSLLSEARDGRNPFKATCSYTCLHFREHPCDYLSQFGLSTCVWSAGSGMRRITRLIWDACELHNHSQAAK